MKKHITLLAICSIVLLSISSCQDTSIINYNVPITYTFENVDYSGPTSRGLMLEELGTYARSVNTTPSNQLSAASMFNMYTNSNAPFSNPELNTSTVDLKSKVAVGFQDVFEDYMTALETASFSANQAAMPNQAGISTSNDGTQHFLLNENGVELSQIIEKGLALTSFYYQATVIYLGETKMNADNRAVTIGRGTNMEHHWDEAFGYFGAPFDFPGNISNLGILAQSSNKVNAVIGCNSKIMNAFLKGRAGVSAKDYNARDDAREAIKQEWEIIIAATAISYLNQAKESANDLALCYHYLTEAYAYIMGLKHGASKRISDTEIDAILITLSGSPDPLQANFYTLIGQDIEDTINALANAYSSLEEVKGNL